MRSIASVGWPGRRDSNPNFLIENLVQVCHSIPQAASVPAIVPKSFHGSPQVATRLPRLGYMHDHMARPRLYWPARATSMGIRHQHRQPRPRFSAPCLAFYLARPLRVAAALRPEEHDGSKRQRGVFQRAHLDRGQPETPALVLRHMSPTPLVADGSPVAAGGRACRGAAQGCNRWAGVPRSGWVAGVAPHQAPSVPIPGPAKAACDRRTQRVGALVDARKGT